MLVLGIDIGGSGIKGAPVDLDRGDHLRRTRMLYSLALELNATLSIWRRDTAALTLFCRIVAFLIDLHDSGYPE